MAYEIILSPEALEHLAALTARQRRIVLDAIETHLTHQPTTSTRRRKPLRPNPLASWELRVGQFRVYYQVESTDGEDTVYVIAVGRKVRNRVIIAGVEVGL
jgi:mRNA-degrading endonuclease RelE of RelBE toxin-antitoxin system